MTVGWAWMAGLRVKGIACGANHTAAFTEQGELYTWGWNEHGRLGLDHEVGAKPVEDGRATACLSHASPAHP
jgi:alpha-tubulin suppressor-like RCC1 family protein